MERKMPKVIIVADKTITDGINNGFYPERAVALSNNEIAVRSKEYCQAHGWILNEIPNLIDGTYYVLNQYSNMYMSLNSDGIVETIEQDKCLAYREALCYLGAKHITLSRVIKHEMGKSIDANINAGYGVAKVDVEIKKSDEMFVNFENLIESNDETRVGDINLAKKFIDGHGLTDDTNLRLLYERLESTGKISGNEKLILKKTQEIKNALNAVCNVSAMGYFNFHSDFERKMHQLHTFTIEINAVF